MQFSMVAVGIHFVLRCYAARDEIGNYFRKEKNNVEGTDSVILYSFIES